MPSKKKKFDKKKGVTFHVVQRSFEDPLADKPGASKFVLRPDIQTDDQYDRMVKLIGDDQDAISHDYRQSYYDSWEDQHSRDYDANDPSLLPHEYDYSKHLKPIDETRFISAKPENLDERTVNIMKMMTVEPSTIDKDLEDVMNAADIVEEPIGGATSGMASEDFFDALVTPAGFEELQDDFITAAMAEDDEKMTKEELNRMLAEDDEDDDDSEAPPLVPDTANDTTRTWLDDHFDYMIEGWDGEHIGALEDDDPGLRNHGELDDAAMERFLQRTKEMTQGVAFETTGVEEEEGVLQPWQKAQVEKARNDAILTAKDYIARRSREDEDKFDVRSLSSNVTKITTFREYTKKRTEAKWDCESILSTRTNHENHPSLLKVKPKASKKIKLTLNSGIPVEALRQMRERGTQQSADPDGSQSDISEGHSQCTETENATASESQFSEMDYNLGRARDKNETKADKKARKRFIKEQRRRNRQRKKKMKGLFKIEEHKQEKLKLGMETAHTSAFRLQS